jgi:HAMP domain-containing protein
VRRRLLLSYMTITVLVLVLLEIPLGISFARTERDRLETDVQHDAFAIAIRSEEALEATASTASPDLQRLVDRYANETGGRAVIVDAAGLLVADSDPPADAQGAGQRSFASRPEIARALRGRETTGTRHSDTLGTDLLYVAVPVASGGEVHGAVRVTYPLSLVSDRVRRNWLVLAGTGGVVLVAVFLVSLWLARSVTRPLADLEHAAARLGNRDLAARAPVHSGPPEVRLLAEEFNATAAQLQELVGAQQRARGRAGGHGHHACRACTLRPHRDKRHGRRPRHERRGDGPGLRPLLALDRIAARERWIRPGTLDRAAAGGRRRRSGRAGEVGPRRPRGRHASSYRDRERRRDRAHSVTDPRHSTTAAPSGLVAALKLPPSLGARSSSCAGRGPGWGPGRRRRPLSTTRRSSPDSLSASTKTSTCEAFACPAEAIRHVQRSCDVR